MKTLKKYDPKSYEDAMFELEEYGEFLLCNNGIQGQAAIDLCKSLHDDYGLHLEFDQNDTLLVSKLHELTNSTLIEAMCMIARHRPNEINVYPCKTLRIWWD